MAQTGKPRSGKNGRLQINGTTLTGAVSIQVQTQTEWHDVTNFETSGFAEGVFGIRQASMSAECYWNAAQNPFDNPPNLKDGQILSTVRAWINVTDIKYWEFPKLAIVSCSMTIPTRGVVAYSIQAQSDGTFTEPTGSV